MISVDFSDDGCYTFSIVTEQYFPFTDNLLNSAVLPKKSLLLIKLNRQTDGRRRGILRCYKESKQEFVCFKGGEKKSVSENSLGKEAEGKNNIRDRKNL